MEKFDKREIDRLWISVALLFSGETSSFGS